MHRCGTAVAEFGQIVSFEDIERADEHDAAGRWRRGADDGVAVKTADDGCALDDGVGGKVFESDESATLSEIANQLLRHLAVVEAAGIGGDALKGARQLRLAEDVAFLIKLPVSLEDALGVCETSQVWVAEFTSLFGGQLEAIGG